MRKSKRTITASAETRNNALILSIGRPSNVRRVALTD